MNYKILKTLEFEDWLASQQAKTRTIILSRLDHISIGHFGDHMRFEGLIELRWLNGIRVYAFLWHQLVVVAICGGNKNGQGRDIKKAKKIRNKILEGTYTIFK